MQKFVAMNVQDWNGFTQAETDKLQVSLTIDAPKGCSGYLPVYDSVEELHAVLPGGKYITVDVGTQ